MLIFVKWLHLSYATPTSETDHLVSCNMRLLNPTNIIYYIHITYSELSNVEIYNILKFNILKGINKVIKVYVNCVILYLYVLFGQWRRNSKFIHTA